MTRPLARRDGVAVAADDEAVTIDGRPLPPLLVLLWLRADGRHDVAGLARILSREIGQAVDADTVWCGLDQLADLGLLTERLAPAASTRHWSRRDFLQGAAAALAAAHGLTSMSKPVRAETPAEAGATAARQSAILRDRETHALEQAHDARLRGALDEAEVWSERAKEANRQRSRIERDAEAASKERRQRQFDRAEPGRVAPAPETTPGRAAEQRRPLAQPDPQGLGDETPPPSIDHDKAPHGDAADRRQREQEQELKRAQERNDKRLRER